MASTTYNAATKVWSGPEIPSNYTEDASVGKNLLEAMLRNPEHIAQICHPNGKTYTNKELANLSISVAHHFTKLGFQQGDIVGICASNTDFLAPLFFGAMFKGLTVNPVDPVYDMNGIKHCFGLTKPKLMFCDGSIYNKVQAALREVGLNCEIYTMKEHIDGKPSIKEFLTHKTETLDYEFETLKMGLIQTAVILFSSGTTGLPKGVRFSNEDLLDRGLSLPDQRILNFSTLNWITAVFILVGGTYTDWTRIISDKPFSTADFFYLVEKYRVSLLFTTPSLMAMILASPRLKSADLSSIKVYQCGGSAVPLSVTKQLQKYMPGTLFGVTYGMTEIRGSAAMGMVSEKTYCVGQLMSNIQIKIIDNDGRKLGPNELGEIFVKTPYKWLGYFENEVATSATYEAEGWIASGDLGYFDADGDLRVIDRKKDILKYYSFHYFPTEIEQVIYELEDVLEVCVCGLPDLIAIDLPTAAVVKRNGSKLSEREIYDHVAQRMDDFKHLRGGVYFLDKMPKTVTDKVLRREVKKICEKLRNHKSRL